MIPVSDMPPDPHATAMLRFTVDDKPVHGFYVGQRVECGLSSGATLAFIATAVDEETGDATLSWVELDERRHA